MAVIFARGMIKFDFNYSGLSVDEKNILTARTKWIVLFTENKLLRGIVSYSIDSGTEKLKLTFIPERWIPRVRPPLTQENVNQAVNEAVERAGRINVKLPSKTR